MLEIAAICTTYFPASHADVIVSRWLEPHPTDARWGWQPRTQIASLYIAQLRSDLRLLDTPRSQSRNLGFNPDLELGQPIARAHGVPMFGSIREALTLGGQSLAVDGVLLIGEHGDYPTNALGQKLYPRKEFFDEIVAVFRESGRCAPVFCDKHLSWNDDWAQAMVAVGRELGFPLMAGSSLPYSFKLKPPLPAGAELGEGVAVFYGGAEVYGFHSLEAMQAFVEARAGGERGIRAITAYRGDDVWEAMAQGVWSRDLFEAALATCQNVAPGDMRQNAHRSPSPHDPWGSPTAFVFEHADGLRTAHIQLDGHIQDFAIAIQRRDGKIHADRWAAGGPEDFYGHFAALNAKIQEMFLTGRAPVPIERNLLTSVAIAACMQALTIPGQRIETPRLQIAYQPQL
ncbi:MAG: hypothetical protein KatS3mg053_1997 [Candidatus Roseilinea sp.]|nr:MAG: hypothetical protein KatS3mg053_1997 [Candidatus Roseilinea sp.]